MHRVERMPGVFDALDYFGTLLEKLFDFNPTLFLIILKNI
jgi:hypothetical protein